MTTTSEVRIQVNNPEQPRFHTKGIPQGDYHHHSVRKQINTWSEFRQECTY